MVRPALKLVAGIVLAALTMVPVGEAVCHMRMELDADLGWVPAPGSQHIWRLEGSGSSSWTHHGIRRTTNPVATNEPVVLVLGDSFTEGLQVNDDEVYTAVLEKEMGQTGHPVTVCNAGFSGLSVADYVHRAGVYKRLLKPAWTVVQAGADDFTTKCWDSSRGRFFFRRAKEGGRLEVVTPAAARSRLQALLRGMPRFLRDYVTLSYMALRIEEFRSWVRNEPSWFRAAGYNHPPAHAPAAPPSDYPIAEELRLLKEALDGRLTLFLLTPYSPLGPTELDPGQSAIIELAREQGIHCVRLDEGYSLLSSARASPYGFDNLLGYNSGHLNREGHRIAGIVLARGLQQDLLNHGIQ